MTKKKQQNDFETQIYEKFSYKNYSSHFMAVYRATGIFAFLLLCVSALFSAKFFESYFIGFFAENAIYLGLVVSALIAVMIALITARFLIYWHYQKTVEPLLGVALISLIGFNFYADFQGAPDWANEIVGFAPTESKTSEIGGIYGPQIQGIEKEIDEIQQKNFYWCKSHGIAHRCDLASYYIDKKDKIHVEKIASLKAQKSSLLATMNTLLSDANTNHQTELNGYNDKLNANRGRMRFGSVIATFFYMLISLWRLKFGVRFVEEKTPTVANETEKAWSQLVEDNPELAEEILARSESEKRGKH
jgi:hypothetical protein